MTERVAQKESQPIKTNRKFFLLILGSIGGIIIFGGLVFLLAGRSNYIQGWILLAICFIILFLSVYSFRYRKDLVEERRKPGPGVKKWDNLIVNLYQILLYILLIIAILDSGRFLWSPKLPFTVYFISALVLLLSSGLSLWALRVNDYFSSKVRIQYDRFHKVVSTGPYRYVRHPGYTGIIIMIFCLPLIMGSLWALIPAGNIAVLFIIRTALEDRTLLKELPGYPDYSRKVRFRLIPGIW